jgi:hypothetical protein
MRLPALAGHFSEAIPSAPHSRAPASTRAEISKAILSYFLRLVSD